MKRAHNHKGDFLRVRLVLVADQTVEGDQVQSGDTNECVDDSGKGGAGLRRVPRGLSLNL